MRLPCISLWQPWASWIALGWKVVETRTHRRLASLAGQRLGIHASQTWDRNAFDIARPYLSPRQRAIDHELYRVRGAIVCTAVAGKERCCQLIAADSKFALIDCDPTSVLRFGTWLSNIERLEPAVKVRGGQGIFYVEVPKGVAA